MPSASRIVRARRALVWGLVAVLLVLQPVPADARMTTIRDAEIENTIRHYAMPLLQAAGLNPDSVHFHIISSSELNAFVAGGQRVFLTTGLLRRADNAGQVIGVIGHELGHVAGGHLASLEGALRDASTQAIVAMLLGAAVGLLARDPQLGSAAIMGGQHIVERSLLRYSQVQERSADQAGLSYMESAGISARGLLEFLKLLEDQELLIDSRRDAYARTHPLTRDRINFVRNHVEKSRWSDTPLSPEIKEMHARMVAKLAGFLDPPARVLRDFPAEDRTVPARYARAVAFHRQGRLDQSLELIDGLLAEHPEDAYFHELRGQILFENGRLDAALDSYETAVSLLPRSGLIRAALAHVQVETGRPDQVRPAH